MATVPSETVVRKSSTVAMAFMYIVYFSLFMAFVAGHKGKSHAAFEALNIEMDSETEDGGTTLLTDLVILGSTIAVTAPLMGLVARSLVWPPMKAFYRKWKHQLSQQRLQRKKKQKLALLASHGLASDQVGSHSRERPRTTRDSKHDRKKEKMDRLAQAQRRKQEREAAEAKARDERRKREERKAAKREQRRMEERRRQLREGNLNAQNTTDFEAEEKDRLRRIENTRRRLEEEEAELRRKREQQKREEEAYEEKLRQKVEATEAAAAAARHEAQSQGNANRQYSHHSTNTIINQNNINHINGNVKSRNRGAVAQDNNYINSRHRANNKDSPSGGARHKIPTEKSGSSKKINLPSSVGRHSNADVIKRSPQQRQRTGSFSIATADGRTKSSQHRRSNSCSSSRNVNNNNYNSKNTERNNIKHNNSKSINVYENVPLKQTAAQKSVGGSDRSKVAQQTSAKINVMATKRLKSALGVGGNRGRQVQQQRQTSSSQRAKKIPSTHKIGAITRIPYSSNAVENNSRSSIGSTKQSRASGTGKVNATSTSKTYPSSSSKSALERNAAQTINSNSAHATQTITLTPAQVVEHQRMLELQYQEVERRRWGEFALSTVVMLPLMTWQCMNVWAQHATNVVKGITQPVKHDMQNTSPHTNTNKLRAQPLSAETRHINSHVSGPGRQHTGLIPSRQSPSRQSPSRQSWHNTSQKPPVIHRMDILRPTNNNVNTNNGRNGHTSASMPHTSLMMHHQLGPGLPSAVNPNMPLLRQGQGQGSLSVGGNLSSTTSRSRGPSGTGANGLLGVVGQRPITVDTTSSSNSPASIGHAPSSKGHLIGLSPTGSFPRSSHYKGTSNIHTNNRGTSSAGLSGIGSELSASGYGLNSGSSSSPFLPAFLQSGNGVIGTNSNKQGGLMSGMLGNSNSATSGINSNNTQSSSTSGLGGGIDSSTNKMDLWEQLHLEQQLLGSDFRMHLDMDEPMDLNSRADSAPFLF